ncbi:MAG: hypothetical protein KF760_27035 [Candidatus Eremiobacteraeota bacterium]|nr:hypothetical protein [Candidatus Eremiobacteraeota bacterium]MCW5869605.1 hypothetical protein [Candidatus Eremiobacteraeota bacterium]
MSSDHEILELRSLALARAVVQKIDADPTRAALAHARQRCSQWLSQRPNPYLEEWEKILTGNWNEIRQVLTDESPRCRELRQNNPFSGVLTPRERWAIYRDAQS